MHCGHPPAVLHGVASAEQMPPQLWGLKRLLRGDAQDEKRQRAAAGPPRSPRCWENAICIAPISPIGEGSPFRAFLHTPLGNRWGTRCLSFPLPPLRSRKISRTGIGALPKAWPSSGFVSQERGSGFGSLRLAPHARSRTNPLWSCLGRVLP